MEMSKSKQTGKDSAEKWLNLKTIQQHVKEYIESHPVIAIWNTVLLAGAAVFLGYFVSIGFMPELDFQASVSLLVAAAVMGSYLLLLFISLLLLPGWIWTIGVISDERLKPLWHKEPEAKGKLEWTRVAWFGVPNFLVVGGFLATSFWQDSLFLGLLASILIFAVIGLFAWYRLSRESKNKSQREKEKKEGKGRAVATYCCSLAATAFTFILSFGFLSILANQNSNFGNGAISLALVVFSAIVLLNAFFITLQTLREYTVVVGVAIIFFTMLSGWDFIPKQVMAFYQLGNMRNASLVFDKTGCSTARQYDVIVDPKSTASETCSVDGATIQSRIGTPFLIEAKDSTENTLSFTIPREHVLSWSPQQRDE